MADPRSGVDEQGAWSPAFVGQRPPFQRGNELAAMGGAAVKHGAYVQTLRLTERIEEISAEIAAAMPHYSAAFAASVQGTAIAGCRLERAVAALDKAKPAEMPALESDCRGWLRQWMAGLDKLGLTPLAASRLGLNLALAGGSARRVMAERYGAVGEGES